MPPVNDDFASATVLSGDSGHATFSNVGATTQAGEPANAEGHSVWFAWTPTVSGTAYVRTGLTPLPAWDSFLAVFTGSSLGTLSLVGSADDNDLQAGATDPFGTSKVTWTATAGTTYYVQVTAYNDVSGPVERSDLRLDWLAVSVPPNATGASPAHGIAGTTVIITGTDLDLATSVTFAGVAASFTINSPTQITTTVPVTFASSSTVVVSNAGGSSSAAFTVWFPGPWHQPADRLLSVEYTGGTEAVYHADMQPPATFFSSGCPNLLGSFTTANMSTDAASGDVSGQYVLVHIAVDLPQFQDTFDPTAVGVEYAAADGTWVSGSISNTRTLGDNVTAPPFDVAVEARLMTPGSYTIHTGVPPLAQFPAAVWQTPADLASYALVATSGLTDPSMAWDVDYDDVYWIGINYQRRGAALPAGSSVGPYLVDATVTYTYTPPRYRWLFLRPQATGWRVGSVAMN